MVSNTAATTVILLVWNGDGQPRRDHRKAWMKQISDTGAIEKIVDQVLAANAKQVEDYRAGKEKAFNSLVGQVRRRPRARRILRR